MVVFKELRTGVILKDLQKEERGQVLENHKLYFHAPI
jgi:hypothetical protein